MSFITPVKINTFEIYELKHVGTTGTYFVFVCRYVATCLIHFAIKMELKFDQITD